MPRDVEYIGEYFMHLKLVVSAVIRYQLGHVVDSAQVTCILTDFLSALSCVTDFSVLSGKCCQYSHSRLPL